MKQIIFIIVINLFLTSCSAQKNINKVCQPEIIESIDFIENSTNSFIDDSKIKKERNKILLPIDNGKDLILKDTLVEEESPDMEQYDFIGFIASNSNYVIHVTYLLDDEIWFIDKSNGKINKGLSYFSVSESGTIATYNKPQSDRYDGVQVFKLINGKRIALCSIKDKEWFPETIVWKNDTEILMKVLYNGKIEYLKLKIE